MPFNFGDFKKQISDSIEEGKAAKDQDRIAELVQEFTPKILKAFQEATEKCSLSATISLDVSLPEDFVDFLENVIRCDVVCKARRYSQDYALVFRHKPTFTGDSMIIERTKVKGFEEFSTIMSEAYEKWEDALVKKFTEPVLKAIKNGERSVAFEGEIPYWVKSLFQNTGKVTSVSIEQLPGTDDYVLHINVK